MNTKKESLQYQDMLKEVQKILSELSSSDIDLDTLVNKIERGYELITLMKTRLEEIKNKVEELKTNYFNTKDSQS